MSKFVQQLRMVADAIEQGRLPDRGLLLMRHPGGQVAMTNAGMDALESVSLAADFAEEIAAGARLSAALQFPCRRYGR